MKFFLPVFLVLTWAVSTYGQDFPFGERAYTGPAVAQLAGLPQTPPAHGQTDQRATPLRRPVRPQTPHYARLDCGVPNPYRPGTPIVCTELSAGAYTLELYDPRGQRVLSQVLSVSRPTVFPEDLPPGTYLVKIRAGGRPLLCERIEVLPGLR